MRFAVVALGVALPGRLPVIPREGAEEEGMNPGARGRPVAEEERGFAGFASIASFVDIAVGCCWRFTEEEAGDNRAMSSDWVVDFFDPRRFLFA